MKRHYAAVSGEQYARSSLISDTDFLNSLVPGVPADHDITLDGNNVSVTVTELDPEDPGAAGLYVQSDIALVLDVSDDVDASELLLLKEATTTIIDGLNLSASEGGVHMGVARFAGSAASVVDMTDVDNPDATPPEVPLRDGVNGLVQGGPGLASGTNLIAGLQGAVAQFVTGLGDRPTVPNLIVMISDGDDNAGNNSGDNDNPATLSAASAASGAEIYVVGIGNKIKTNSLKAIASEDEPSDPGYSHSDPTAGHRYHVANFAGLMSIVSELAEKVIQSSQTRVFRIVSIVNGFAVESIVAIGFDGSANTRAWSIN